jgi:hypothetical protein
MMRLRRSPRSDFNRHEHSTAGAAQKVLPQNDQLDSDIDPRSMTMPDVKNRSK